MAQLLSPRLLMGLTLGCVALTTRSEALEPAPVLPAAPSPLPASFPSGFATFTPPVDNALVPASNAPAFAEWTRNVGPGDSVVLTGNKLSSYSNADVGRDSRFLVYGQSPTSTQGVAVEADIQRLKGDQVAITLPTSLPAGSLYFIWPKNNAGTGRPAVLNRTDPWWVGPNSVEVNKSFSVFGRNLGSWVYLQASSGAGQWIQATSFTSYKANYTLPANVSPGTYKVWAHNGMGGNYGWGKSLTLIVTATYAWTTTVINVKNYGAQGNGVADDRNAILAAMTAANASTGSTLYFPAGTYIMNRAISLNDGNGQAQSDMKWLGDKDASGVPTTKIMAGPNYAEQTDESRGLAFFDGKLNNVQFKNITFDTGGSPGLISSDRGTVLLRFRGSSNVRFDNVRFTQQQDPYSTQKLPNGQYVPAHYTPNFSPIEFGATGSQPNEASAHVYFNSCDFVETNGAFSGSSQQVFFDNCTFKGVNDANALLYIWNAKQVSITNCKAKDFNTNDVRPDGNNGWGKRFVCGRNGKEGATSEIYFGGNETIDLAPRTDTTQFGTNDMNTGEQFLLEGTDTIAQAQATAGTANTVTVPGTVITDGTNQIASIVAGRGVGQSRLISGSNGSTFTVSEDWNVIPDNTSTVCIGSYLDHIAVIGNTFDGKDTATAAKERITASSGIQQYGSGSNFVATSNTFNDLRYGIVNWSILNYATNPTNPTDTNYVLYEPNFFNDYSSNTTSNCYIGMRNVLGYGLPGTPSGTFLLGNRFSGNTINATQNGIDFFGDNSPTANHSAGINLFQKNTINAKNGWVSYGSLDNQYPLDPNTGTFYNYPGMEQEVLVGNTVTSSGGVGAKLDVATEQPAFRQNTWTPSGSAYSGTAATGILEVPRRYQHFDVASGTSSTSGSFTVWNSGTGSLSWTASSSATWLQFSPASGTIANENSSSTLNFTINSSSLPNGNSEAVITLSGGGKIQKVTVNVTVTGAITPTPTPSGNGTGLKGDYYSGTSFNTLIKTQTDPTVNFNWGWNGPTDLNGNPISSIDINNYSVRWTGQVQAIESGTYTFSTTTDDGARLWIGDINGTPLIDKWNTQASTSWSGTITLVAGQKYNIRMDYFEGYDLAEARLSWLRPGASTSVIIPQSQLYPTTGTVGGSGTITREVWTGIDGNDVVTWPLANTPNVVGTLTSLEAPTNYGDGYLQRLRGTITAPTTGSYTFWIAGDDATELWLSTNSSAANKVKIAYNTQWTSSREWNKYTTQKSATISLTAGQQYYIEALHKEGGEGDNLAVGWLKPGQTGTVPSEVVPGSVLSPMP